MQIVVSQAWTLDADGHADEYVTLSSAFEDFYRSQPGFVSRVLIRGLEDRTHFVHLRFFESIDHYTSMTEIPEYQAHIRALSEHVDVSRYADGYPREFADVVWTSDPSPP